MATAVSATGRTSSHDRGPFHSPFFWIYNSVGTVGGILTAPIWGTYVALSRKYRANFAARMGRGLAALRPRLAEKPTIWIHAVSVGEFNLAYTLLQRLRPRYPGFRFVVSVTTLTGYALARERLSSDDVLLYFPFEWWPVMRRAVRAVRPRLAIIVETELWPNFLYALSADGVPCVLVNGRISAKSYARYRLFKPFMRDLLCRIAHFNMQTPHDAARIRALGAPPDRVSVTGNIKFDAVRLVDTPQPDAALVAELGLPATTPVFLAAALDKSGCEDAVMLDVWEQLRVRFPEAALILVPRHPERGPEMATMVSDRGYVPRRRSLRESFTNPQREVFIVDTIGELGRFYTLARTAFVGKSLFPPGGGQNMIEPVALGVPTLYGPYTCNFRGVADVLAEHGGAVIVHSPAELAETLINLWSNPAKAREVVTCGQAFIRSQQGALQANLDVIAALLPGGSE